MNKTKYCIMTVDKDSRLMDKLVDIHVTDLPLRAFVEDSLGAVTFKVNYDVHGHAIAIHRTRPTRFTDPALPILDTRLDIHGRIVDENGQPLAKATIASSGRHGSFISDSAGQFHQLVKKNSTLVITHVGMDSVSIIVSHDTDLVITLHPFDRPMEEVVFTSGASNGITPGGGELPTGSYSVIPSPVLDRNPAGNILDRLDNTAAGILMNHGGQSKNGSTIPDKWLIRGRSTFFGSPDPLIVVDNFAYDGDINNINPNDIESVTVLKDASASAIWGARAGNGVIVLTTRKSRFMDTSNMRRPGQPKITGKFATSIQPAPDLRNISSISGPDFAHLEKTLFQKGYYDADLTSSPAIAPITPVIALLQAARQGLITQADADTRIATLSNHNVWSDIRRYLYRPSILQQYYLQASAGTSIASYYFSAGFDRTTGALVGSHNDRLSLKWQNVVKMTDRLQLNMSALLTQTIASSGNNPGYGYRSPHGGKGFYPYGALVDDNGQPRPLYLDYSRSYLAKTDSLGFLPWSWSPVTDIGAEDNSYHAHDWLLNAGLKYTIRPQLELDVKYQLEKGATENNDLHTADSYFARDLINSFTQVDPNTNTLSLPVPAGAVLDYKHTQTISQQARAQLNFHHFWKEVNDLSIQAGSEIRSLVTTLHGLRYYGYDVSNTGFNMSMNYSQPYVQYGLNDPRTIPNLSTIGQLTDHFISYYANSSYTYKKLYSLSGSIRHDAANLFGASTNNKWVPLWSLGTAWLVSNEEFYHQAWLPEKLKLRMTYGISGNVDQKASANTAISFLDGSVTNTPYNSAYIVSPPNQQMRWEQVHIFNTGLDFETRSKRINGTIEYYRKKATDLLAPIPADPTLGLSTGPGSAPYYFGNAGSLASHGADIRIETSNCRPGSKLQWQSRFMFSWSVSRVTSYYQPLSTGNAYLDQNSVNPLVGRPIYAVYAYKWGGLSPQTGDPQGYLNGKPSNDWNAIVAGTSPDSLQFEGSTLPTIFGNLLNIFQYKRFSLSFNISYKMGYYFRRPSISYSDAYATWTAHGDYTRRWQSSGDERRTNVPSMGYPGSNARDQLYLYSSALVQRADHIRLEDIRIDYTPGRWNLFINVNNLGTLWKANKGGIDPYYINVPKDGKRFTVGFNYSFVNFSHANTHNR